MSNEKKPGEGRSGFSRRDFIRGSTVGALGTGLLTQVSAAEAAVADVEVLGPGSAAVTLNVNGQNRELQVEPRVTLLDALRNRLDLTGAKKVCDRASCGACTVLVDGRIVYACTLLAIEAQGKRIETVESLGNVDRLHPIQAAFVEHDAQQCGFCTPGFVMAAKELLERKPNPTVEEIHQGLGGNICRCGTYVGLKKAVRQVAESRGGRSHG